MPVEESGEPNRYDSPPLILHGFVALLVAVLVGWYVLTQVRSCVTICNGDCHDTCEPSLLDRWLDR